MLAKLANFNRSTWFWAGLMFICIVLEGAALYYQYVLDYAPCVLCIHIRVWVFVIMLAAMLGLFLRKTRGGTVIANLLTLTAGAGMLERSYIVLGTERGFIDGSCGDLKSGFPEWFALDKWVPFIFEPLESCGLTPWVIPQWLSMADALILMSGGLMLMMLGLVLSSFLYPAKSG